MFDRHIRNADPTGSAVCITVSHLQWFGDGPTTAEVIYLGYPLHLSVAERRILFCLLHALGEGRTCVSTEELEAALADGKTASAGDRASASGIGVYLARINDKARDIGDRDLILRDRHRGYRLNLYM